MKDWCYRVVANQIAIEGLVDDTVFPYVGIYMFGCDESGEIEVVLGDKPELWFNSVEELKFHLLRMLEALEKPVLPEEVLKSEVKIL